MSYGVKRLPPSHLHCHAQPHLQTDDEGALQEQKGGRWGLLITISKNDAQWCDENSRCVKHAQERLADIENDVYRLGSFAASSLYARREFDHRLQELHFMRSHPHSTRSHMDRL